MGKIAETYWTKLCISRSLQFSLLLDCYNSKHDQIILISCMTEDTFQRKRKFLVEEIFLINNNSLVFSSLTTIKLQNELGPFLSLTSLGWVGPSSSQVGSSRWTFSWSVVDIAPSVVVEFTTFSVGWVC